MNFQDVSYDRWSYEAIGCAAEDGILTGFPDGTFGPEQPLTREQAAVMWQRIKRYTDGNYLKNR